MKLTMQQLRQVMNCSEERATIFIEPINLTLERYDIKTPEQIAMFLAQVGHESGGLKYVKEIWGPTLSQQRYEGRKDLGNTQRGDGKRYMGRGLIQITGRANYTRIAKDLDIDCLNFPEILEEPLYAALSAGQYWEWFDLKNESDLKKVTRKINGGYNGLEDRELRYATAIASLNA